MSVEMARPYLDPAVEALLATRPASRKALFLDRDGVINVDHGYVHRPEDTEWVHGIFDLCETARERGYLLIVITNQAGIARGYYSAEEFLAYTRWMHEQFAKKGSPLAATYYCPHHEDYTGECACRKPKPGMILSAISYFNISVKESLLIGDKSTDLDAGIAAGLTERGLINVKRCDLPSSLIKIAYDSWNSA